jgi:hypothetical protein
MSYDLAFLFFVYWNYGIMLEIDEMRSNPKIDAESIEFCKRKNV